MESFELMFPFTIDAICCGPSKWLDFEGLVLVRSILVGLASNVNAVFNAVACADCSLGSLDHGSAAAVERWHDLPDPWKFAAWYWSSLCIIMPQPCFCMFFYMLFSPPSLSTECNPIGGTSRKSTKTFLCSGSVKQLMSLKELCTASMSLVHLAEWARLGRGPDTVQNLLT